MCQCHPQNATMVIQFNLSLFSIYYTLFGYVPFRDRRCATRKRKTARKTSFIILSVVSMPLDLILPTPIELIAHAHPSCHMYCRKSREYLSDSMQHRLGGLPYHITNYDSSETFRTDLYKSMQETNKKIDSLLPSHFTVFYCSNSNRLYLSHFIYKKNKQRSYTHLNSKYSTSKNKLSTSCVLCICVFVCVCSPCHALYVYFCVFKKTSILRPKKKDIFGRTVNDSQCLTAIDSWHSRRTFIFY